MGFVSDTDYVRHDSNPVVAFVGDSYVEAHMVAYRKTCAGRLATALEGRARVYPFGMSGAPLSEYLGYAEFARDRFQPKWLVLVVVGNDFDESLRQYRRTSQFRSFVDRDGEFILTSGSPRVVDTQPGLGSRIVRIVRQSSLVRYLVYNVQVIDRFDIAAARLAAFARLGEPVDAPDGASGSPEDDRSSESRRAIAAFLTMLPRRSGVPSGRTMLVVDGSRPALYDSSALERAEQGFSAGCGDT